ncbi:MAG: DUF2723 domain-containing protein, partial [Balneolaceae bacterium]|nr:DUF2723 domain-containing protein [Balneolaceae bacterium]
EVEGVRTDVRVVCLSLLNTEWYIKQLRDQWSHESAPLPISLTDREVEEITSSLSLYEPDTLQIPVNKDLLDSAFSGDETYKETIGVKPDMETQLFKEGVDFGIPLDSLDSQVSWYYEGRSAGRDAEGNPRYYTQVQDDVILDMLQTNRWLRPIYFANTVSTNSQLNLQNYFRFEGKAFRVVPQHHPEAGSFGWIDPEIHASRLKKFRFREWDNPDAYFDENIRRMLGNYRYGITQLAETYRAIGQPDSAVKWLKWGEEKIPFKNKIGSLNSLVLYAYSYAQSGDTTNAIRLAELGTQKVMDDLTHHMERYDQLQGRVMQLDAAAKEARKNANMSRQRNYRRQIQEVLARREGMVREISFSLSHLTIVQRIYFMADRDEEALQLADRVNSITMDRIGIPASEEENRKQVEQFNLF